MTWKMIPSRTSSVGRMEGPRVYISRKGTISLSPMVLDMLGAAERGNLKIDFYSDDERPGVLGIKASIGGRFKIGRPERGYIGNLNGAGTLKQLGYDLSRPRVFLASQVDERMVAIDLNDPFGESG